MNAPVKIQIDDQQARKADLWDALQAGELGAHEADTLYEALYRQAQQDREMSIRLTALSRKYQNSLNQYDIDLSKALYMVARHMNMLASNAQCLRDKFNEGGNAYIMPGDA